MLAKQKDEKEALQAKSVRMEAENLRQTDQLDHLRAKMQWNEAWLLYFSASLTPGSAGVFSSVKPQF